MQKQGKQLLILLALVLAFGAAYIGMRAYNDKQEEKEKQEEEAARIYVNDVRQEDITAFSYQTGETTLHFVKEGDTWTSQEDTAELDQSKITEMLSAAAPLEAEGVIEEESQSDPSEYGMDSPLNVITLTTAEGSITLTVGMENPVTGQYYVTRSGDERLYLVAGSFPSSFEKSLEDLKAQKEETESES